jgi:hypothetical protein
VLLDVSILRYPTKKAFGAGTDDLDDIVAMGNQEQEYSDYDDYQAWNNQNDNNTDYANNETN